MKNLMRSHFLDGNCRDEMHTESSIIRWSAVVICAGLLLILLQLGAEFTFLWHSDTRTRAPWLSYVGVTVLCVGGILMSVGGLIGALRWRLGKDRNQVPLGTEPAKGTTAPASGPSNVTSNTGTD
jgi:hypothetical protein